MLPQYTKLKSCFIENLSPSGIDSKYLFTSTYHFHQCRRFFHKLKLEINQETNKTISLTAPNKASNTMTAIITNSGSLRINLNQAGSACQNGLFPV